MRPVAVALAAVACVSCGGGSAPPPETSAPAPASASPRVFFMQPTSGATVKNPVNFVFGSESFTISPVPEGEVTTARPGIGHYHLGVDTDCLPTGQVIPKADPWIHFGKGNNTIEMPSLPPGQHKFSVQVGDDLHATIAGLCETISITVE
jgi:hypothetical protein